MKNNFLVDHQCMRLAGSPGIKTFILMIAVIFISGLCESAFAQDLLILKSGAEIKVNIVEEGPDIIKYREFENPAGPLYSVAKDKVASVKYDKARQKEKENNIREVETPGTDVRESATRSGLLTTTKRSVYLDGVLQAPRSLRLLMEDQNEALKLYESGKKMFRASNACPIAVMIITFSASQSMNKMEEQSDRIPVGIAVLSIDGALIIAGILLASKGKSKLRSSVTMYNSAPAKSGQYSLKFGVQENGIGFAYKF